MALVKLLGSSQPAFASSTVNAMMLLNVSHNLSDFYFVPCALSSLVLILTVALISTAQIRTLGLRNIKLITQDREGRN